MFHLDFTVDLSAHEIVPFCDGQGVLLKKLRVHSFLRRQINSLFSLKEFAEFPGSRPTVLSHERFLQITKIHTDSYQNRNFSSKKETVAKEDINDTKEKKDLSKKKLIVYENPHQEPFFVTEKTDGKRMYLYFCTPDYNHKFQVAIDPKYNMHLVSFDVPNEFYEGTLLDGELVQDTYISTTEQVEENSEKNQKKTKYVFYVFDCLQCMGTPVNKQWFCDRIQLARELVSRMKCIPTTTGASASTSASTSAENCMISPFEIRIKDFYPLHQINKLLHTFPFLLHANDGLIINQNEAIANCFHCLYTSKWKSFRDITMDFLFLFHEETKSISFFTRKRKKPVFQQGVEATLKNCNFSSSTCSSNIKNQITVQDRICHPILLVPREHLNLQIVECFYCPHEKLWKPKRIRRDKEYPNSLHVLLETIKIMKKPIYLSEIIKAWTL